MSAPSGRSPLLFEPEPWTADAMPITLPDAVRMSYSVTSSGCTTGLNSGLCGVVMLNVTDPRSPHPVTTKAATNQCNRRMLRHFITDGSQLNYARFIGMMEDRSHVGGTAASGTFRAGTAEGLRTLSSAQTPLAGRHGRDLSRQAGRDPGLRKARHHQEDPAAPGRRPGVH